jgi:CelD/BcsL family acetyltransferase involved in cellulose biosynthesis
LAPLLRARLGAGLLRLDMLVGIGQESADYGGMLLGDRPEETGAVLLSHLATEMRRGRVAVNLTRVRPDGDLLPILQQCCGGPDALGALVREDVDTYPYLNFAEVEDPATYVRKLETRNDVRRRLRRLQEAHDVVFEYDVEPTPEAMNALFRLYEQRWGSKEGKASGIFAGPRRQAFAVDVARALHESGLSKLSFVYADGAPIAGRFGFEMDRAYLGYKEAFDDQFSKYGPGHLIVSHILGIALEHDLCGFDFMRGDGDHKSVWANEAREVGYWTLHPDSARGRIQRRIMWQLMRLRVRRWSRGAPRSMFA